MKRTIVALRFGVLLPVLLMLATGLFGCGKFLDPGPPIPRVVLNPELPASTPASALPLQILVARPEAGNDIDTERIAAIFDGFTIKYLGNARWALPAPVMLQRLMVESLEAASCFSGVGDESSGLTSQLRLSMDIRRFHLRYDPNAQPVVDMALTLRLVDLKTGTSLGFTRLEATQPAKSEELRDLIEAFNTVVSRMLKQGSAWVFEAAAPVKR